MILAHVKEQNQKLSNELKTVTSQLEDKKQVEVELNQKLVRSAIASEIYHLPH